MDKLLESFLTLYKDGYATPAMHRGIISLMSNNKPGDLEMKALIDAIEAYPHLYDTLDKQEMLDQINEIYGD